MFVVSCATEIDTTGIYNVVSNGGGYVKQTDTVNESTGIVCDYSSDASDEWDACMNDSCCTEIYACENDTYCGLLVNCDSGCYTNDCTSSCLIKYPDGYNAYIELVNCVTLSCNT